MYTVKEVTHGEQHGEYITEGSTAPQILYTLLQVMNRLHYLLQCIIVCVICSNVTCTTCAVQSRIGSTTSDNIVKQDVLYSVHLRYAVQSSIFNMRSAVMNGLYYFL